MIKGAILVTLGIAQLWVAVWAIRTHADRFEAGEGPVLGGQRGLTFDRAQSCLGLVAGVAMTAFGLASLID